MKISYNWLRQYVPLEESAEKVADLLTMSGLEVDGLEDTSLSVEGVVVGHVEQVERHPNADRLSVCQVNVAQGAPLQIVCGAPNVAAGQRVPVALVGTTLHLPSRENPATRVPVEIRKAKIRGTVSHGMICAEDELGLSEDHSGIMVLSPEAEVGQPFDAYLREAGYESGDAVLDVAVTPNRPDAVSHIGVARDLSALTGHPLRIPEVTQPAPGGEAAEHVRVRIEAPEGCHRYVAMVVRGIEVRESPAWLKQRLESVGLRPRNNVVDVTNYVMYECGQPLHAFDQDQLAGGGIRVRFSTPGEPFTTLDSKRRTLPEDTLLICDEERPVAIAGVMGGENSEVTEATVNVVLESAYFDPSTIRRAARALGMQTDASYRFERGIDADGQVWAAARAAALIAELAGGEIVKGMVDAHPVPPERRELRVNAGEIERVLGLAVPVQEASRLLQAIGFEVQQDGEELLCVVPTYRPDVERPIDVIEEVARLYGYDRIPEPATMQVPASLIPRSRPVDLVRSRARAVLEGAGYREVFTNSLLSRATADRFLAPALAFLDEGDVVPTLNPISQEMAALRPTLLPGVLEVLQHNRNHGVRQLQFFEMGRVFRGGVNGATIVEGYREEEALLVVTAGHRRNAAWYVSEEEADIYDIKGVLERVLDSVKLPAVRVEPVYEETTLSAYHLRVFAGTTYLGCVARLSRTVAARYDLENVYFAELSVDRLTAETGLAEPHQFAGVSRHPRVERDLAFVVPAAQEVGPILQTMHASGGDLLQRVTPFDLYSGKGVPDNHKSVAFALSFGADRTLTDEEVEAAVRRIVQAVQEGHRADLRA